MIFDVCEILRERIGDINDKVLGKYNEIIKAQEEREAADAAPMTFQRDEGVEYTPVTPDTFAKWCSEFMAKLKAQEAADMTEQDLRKTGK